MLPLYSNVIKGGKDLSSKMSEAMVESWARLFCFFFFFTLFFLFFFFIIFFFFSSPSSSSSFSTTSISLEKTLDEALERRS